MASPPLPSTRGTDDAAGPSVVGAAATPGLSVETDARERDGRSPSFRNDDGRDAPANARSGDHRSDRPDGQAATPRARRPWPALPTADAVRAFPVVRTVADPAARAWRRVCDVNAALGPYPVDTALALLVFGTMFALLCLDTDGSPRTAPWYAFVLIVATSLPLIWRRRFPFSVAMVVAVSAIGYDRVPALPSQHLQYGALIAVYTVADRGPDVIRRWIPLLSVAGLLASGLDVSDLVYGNMFPLLSLLAAYVLGCSTRTRRIHAATLEERAAQLVRARDLEADRAALRERERIAREMHDILGHAVSLMVVQAEAGAAVVHRDPDRAVAVFDAIADAGRDAMAQLRRLLGLLSDPDGGPRAGVDEAAARAPQAGVDTLPDLLARVRDAGLRVSFTETGPARPLPPDVSLAVYRLVQESLTNTVRHAHARHADVTLSWTPGRLDVEVRDDGTGPAAGAGAAKSSTSGGGHGLAGLAHRVQAAGGTLHTGPGEDGRGFRVAARLPLAPETVGEAPPEAGPGVAERGLKTCR
ncbi:sensor histidine kinase [Yinghuangia seranimata]|uniref:sensor histidine kinase n=1 Tax=Yinghuangia seranimata TaxID=408067 RepID=UPI00248B4595|nr:histidine kinase [Yinghuangia seranimata]MDI2127772.1 histidine kinase [Yinghuangia seranimata]